MGEFARRPQKELLTQEAEMKRKKTKTPVTTGLGWMELPNQACLTQNPLVLNH